MRNCGGYEDKRKARKTMMAAAAGIAGAVLLSLTDSGTAGMTAYAFNIGPGMEDHDIIYYQEQPENNPAYNNAAFLYRNQIIRKGGSHGR